MDSKKPFYVLIAELGQLCGNGQLRETISERRNKRGGDVAFWYLPPSLVNKFGISDSNFEAVVADEKTAINWLQLRFGGKLQIMEFLFPKNFQDLKKLFLTPCFFTILTII